MAHHDPSLPNGMVLPMIACSNLTRRFGSVAVVDAISFDLPQGSICAFLGPNGAGKSTTLNMLAGLLAPTSGTITVAGLNVNGPDTPLALKRQIGVLPEGLGLFDSLSVEEHLHLSGPIYGLSKQETRKRTRDVLRSDRSPRTQRDSVARIASLLGPLATLILRELRRTTSVVGNHFLMFVLFLFAMSPNSAAFLGMVAGLVILFPLSADPLRRLPRERLRLLPLSHPERIRLRALSLLLSPPLWIAVAVPLVWGRRHVGVSLVVLLLAALSNGLALLWEGNAARMQRFNPLRHLPFFPGALGGLVTKNLREMFSVLDPYAGLLLSLAALIFRTTSPKPVPEAMHGMAMLVALTLSSYAQRLFALDGHQGLQRYRLMPLRGWQVLLAKDLAFLLVLTLLVIPMNLVSGLCGGLVLLAVGHGPSVRDPQPQPRWRFVTGARGWSGWIQVFALFGVGALAFSLKGVAGIPCMILYGLSLFHYGRRFDRR